MKVVRIDGEAVPPGARVLHGDDPLARAGDGLIETMRAEDGRVPLLDRHLARMAASAAVLGMAGIPAPGVVRDEVTATLAAAGDGPLRVRVCVGARPTLWVEAATAPPLAEVPPAVAAVSIADGWFPGLRIAEHKTSSRAGWAAAERHAAAMGADVALVLDADGRLGEASTANVVVAVGTHWLTAPATGLLAGVGRALLLEAVPRIRERAATRDEWTRADEIVLVGAFSGARSVVRLDGRPVGGGGHGPLAQACGRVLRRALSGG